MDSAQAQSIVFCHLNQEIMMPEWIIHSPSGTFDATARQQVASGALPLSVHLCLCDRPCGCRNPREIIAVDGFNV